MAYCDLQPIQSTFLEDFNPGNLLHLPAKYGGASSNWLLLSVCSCGIYLWLFIVRNVAPVSFLVKESAIHSLLHTMQNIPSWGIFWVAMLLWVLFPSNWTFYLFPISFKWNVASLPNEMIRKVFKTILQFRILDASCQGNWGLHNLHFV